MAEQIVRSTCWECSVRCGSLVHVKNGRATKITGDPSNPYSKGAFCVKGTQGALTLTYHPKRVLYPLRRIGSGPGASWQRISWDEALDEMAERFGAIKEKWGPLAICGAVSGPTYSRGVAMALLLRSIGSPNIMINQDLCHGSQALSHMVTGTSPLIPDIGKTRCVLIVGKNPSTSNVVQWRAIKEAKQRGTKVLVVDPRLTKTARIGDQWIRIKPGTDGALGLALLNIIIEKNWYDRDFVQRWCHGFEELRKRVKEFTPELASEITGIPAKQIFDVANIYVTNKPAVLLLGHGVEAFEQAVQTARTYHCLMAISGNIGVPGGHLVGGRLPGQVTFADFIHRRDYRLPEDIEKQAIGADRFPLWSGPGGVHKACHNPSVIDAILTGKPYSIRALFVSGVNIAVTYPDTRRTLLALKNLDYLVAAVHNMTPVAELAHLVLPKTTTLEENELVWHPGSGIGVTQRVVPTLGEAKSDMDVVAALVKKMEKLGILYRNFIPWNNHEEFCEYLLKNTEIPFNGLRKAGFIPVPARLLDAGWKFNTPTGKLEINSTVLEENGYDPLPCFSPPSYQSRSKEGETFPLILISGVRSMVYHHSRFRDHSWARKLEPFPKIYVHPLTAAARELKAGDWAWLSTANKGGRCKLLVELSEDLSPEVIVTGVGWWNPEAAPDDPSRMEWNINMAMSYGPPWDAIAGSSNTKGIPCELTPVVLEPSDQ